MIISSYILELPCDKAIQRVQVALVYRVYGLTEGEIALVEGRK